MKKMDIEHLLQWAYQRELPKSGRRAPAYWDIGRVDKSLRPAAFGGEVPHGDAVQIDRAVDKLRPSTLTEPNCRDLLGDYAPLGDSEIGAIANKAVFNTADLVRECAELGERRAHVDPRWSNSYPLPHKRLDQFLDSMGRVKACDLVLGLAPGSGDVPGATLNYVVLRKLRGRRRQAGELYDSAFAPFSPVDWKSPTIGELLERRAEYAVWHAALTELVRKLDLAAFEPTGPAAPARPWLTSNRGRATGDSRRTRPELTF